MNIFVLNIVLTGIWMLLTENITLFNFILGFIISYIVLFLINYPSGNREYFRKFPIFLKFTGSFLKELILANLKIAHEIVTPKHKMTAGIVAIPLEELSDLEITWFANLITLTPGTLSIVVSDDRKVLYVHAMYIKDVEDFRLELKHKFEREIMRITK